jgi:hypothetical protein
MGEIETAAEMNEPIGMVAAMARLAMKKATGPGLMHEAEVARWRIVARELNAALERIEASQTVGQASADKAD